MASLISHLEASESPRFISLVTLSRGPLWSPQGAKEVLPYSLVSFPLQLIENATWLLTHSLDRASSGYNSLSHCGAVMMKTVPNNVSTVFLEGKMLMRTLLSHGAVTSFCSDKIHTPRNMEVGLRNFLFKHPASS